MDLTKHILLVFIGLALFMMISFGVSVMGISGAGSVATAWFGELTWIKNYNPHPVELLFSIISTFLPALAIAVIGVRYFESSKHDATTAAYIYGIANAVVGAGVFFFAASSFRNVDYFSLEMLLPLALVSVIKFLGSLLCGALGTTLTGVPFKSKHRRAYQE